MHLLLDSIVKCTHAGIINYYECTVLNNALIFFTISGILYSVTAVKHLHLHVCCRSVVVLFLLQLSFT